MEEKRNLRYLYWKAANTQAVGTTLETNPAWSHINMEEKAQILSNLPDLKGLRVLELGAGIGRYTRELARRAQHVVALDFIDDVIAQNRERNRDYSNIEYVCSNALGADFPPGSFDLVFSNWLLMYLHEPEVDELLKKCRAWLSPGGYAFFRESCEVRYHGMGTWRKYFSRELVEIFIPFLGNGPHSIWKFKLPPLKDLIGALKSFESTAYYRKASFYEGKFMEHFDRVADGYVAVYEKRYKNKEQRYWLLTARM